MSADLKMSEMGLEDELSEGFPTTGRAINMACLDGMVPPGAMLIEGFHVGRMLAYIVDPTRTSDELLNIQQNLNAALRRLDPRTDIEIARGKVREEVLNLILLEEEEALALNEEDAIETKYVGKLYPVLRMQLRNVVDFENEKDLREKGELIVSQVYDLVFADQEIAKAYTGEIRRYQMCAQVMDLMLRKLGLDFPIYALGVGTVELPKNFKWIKDRALAENVVKSCGINPTAYDLPAQSLEKIRRSLCRYFLQKYGVDRAEYLAELFTENMGIFPGGIQALSFLFKSAVLHAVDQGKKLQFVIPDNSFPTAVGIMKSLAKISPESVNVTTLDTTAASKFHLTPEIVREHYKNRPPNAETNSVWYLTPVGNPSGTKCDPENLLATCEAILEEDPEATIILDVVYIRLLNPVARKEMMNTMMQNKTVLNRIFFIESFSKSHGLCASRVGAYFTANKELFELHHPLARNETVGVPNGVYTLAYALAEMEETQDEESLEDLHKFWGQEREEMYNWLIASGEYSDLFEVQEHLDPIELQESGTLYLLLKLQEEVSPKDVLIRTGCSGVPVKWKSGNYIRFALSTITEPTFSVKRELSKKELRLQGN